MKPISMLSLHAACEPIFAALYAEGFGQVKQRYDERVAAYRAQVVRLQASLTERPSTNYYDRTADLVRYENWLREELANPPERVAMERACDRLTSTPEGQALVAALDSAQWGAQGDGSFVTSNHNAHWIADSGDYVQLHAPAKQGALAGATVHCEEPHSLSFFSSRADARTKREERRAHAREAHERYGANLKFVSEQLRTNGARWAQSGVFGGTIYCDRPEDCLADDDLPQVSARGALMRAWGIRCTCGRRAGHHAERLPMVPCDGCERVEAFGTIAERFRKEFESEKIDGTIYSRADRIWLFADGALAIHAHEYIVWGELAHADALDTNSTFRFDSDMRSPIRIWRP